MTVDPCWCLIFLGIELDTAEMQARHCMEKNEQYSNHVEEVLQKNTVTLKVLVCNRSVTVCYLYHFPW